MAWHHFFYRFLFLALTIPTLAFSQIGEEESAEVFLEEYSDAFQEKFFEALKERGIENYDRAINILLECKQMEPDYVVLDHELAQAYLLTGDLDNALEFALDAVNAEPANYWFANTLIHVLARKNMKVEQLKADIPINNIDLAQNLTQSLFKNRKYEEALKWVNFLNPSAQNKHLKSKIEDSIAKQNRTKAPAAEVVESERTDDPVATTIMELKALINRNAVSEVLTLAIEASESYPSQPYFYYAHGWALHQQGEHKRALRSLETGLDYLIDDDNLANTFFKTLASTHKALGNTSKANSYLSKVKTGS